MATKKLDRKRTYAVITADIVDSRKILHFHGTRDQKLKEISGFHQKRGLIASPYTVTAWDEFQVILSEYKLAPQAIFDLRRTFFPLKLWIAVGIGQVEQDRQGPINEYAGGEAFERARKAADRLKTRSSRPSLTMFDSRDATFDLIANTIYGLQDTMLEDVTEKQWATINMQVARGRQDRVARDLDLDVSTVSRNLKRGYYWQMTEVIDAVSRIMVEFF